MGPLSITVGLPQIIELCTQVKTQLTRQNGHLQTIDEQFNTFSQEAEALLVTAELLLNNVRSPAMARAAQTSEHKSGGDLWRQIASCVQACERTMLNLDGTLNILLTSGRPHEEVRQSLVSGSLFRLRQRIQLFTSTLALPSYMMAVELQIEQQYSGMGDVTQLNTDLRSLHNTIDKLAATMRKPAYLTDSDGASTADFEDDKEVYGNLAGCVRLSRRFLSDASAASSWKAGAGFASSNIDLATTADMTFASDWGKDEHKVYIPQSPKEVSQAATAPSEYVDEDEDSDIDYELTQNFLRNGRAKTEKGDYAAAETCFRKALGKLQGHDFGTKNCVDTADVQLMLATACFKQNKFDEAQTLLLTISNNEDPSVALRTCAARHLLGTTYLLNGNLEGAETSIISAVKGRRKRLGKTHPLCIESVRQLIQVYSAMGDEAEIEAWQTLLPSPTPQSSQLSRPITPAVLAPSSHLPELSALAPVPSTHTPGSSSKVPCSLSEIADFSTQMPLSSSQMPALLSLLPETGSLSKAKSQKPTSYSFFPFRTSSKTPGQTQDRSRSPLRSAESRTSIATQSDTQESDLYTTSSGTTTSPRSNKFSVSSIATSMAPEVVTSDNMPRDRWQLETNELTMKQRLALARFSNIQGLCKDGDYEGAVKEAKDFLESYLPELSARLYLPEIEENVRKSQGRGLAGTGQGFAPLHFFASLPNEHAFEIDVLISQGVDVNATTHSPFSTTDSRAYVALQFAAVKGHAQVASLLASVPGIDLEYQDSNHLTPLFTAWDKGHMETVTTLLKYGAQPNGISYAWQGNSLLHGAAWLCNVQITQQLLAILGVDINARNGIGSTPLIASIISSDIEDPQVRRRKITNRMTVIKLLLRAGANFRLRDEAGHNAMHYAELEKDTSVVALLEGRGARREIVEAHPLHPYDTITDLVKRVVQSPGRLEAKHQRKVSHALQRHTS